MKKNISSLIFYLVASGLLSNIALAKEPPAVSETVGDVTAEDPSSAQQTNPEEKSETEEPEPMVPAEYLSQPIRNEIELGIGYVSDDAYRFGRYNGLQTKGPYVIGDIKIREFHEDGHFWSIRGTNLGLESRYLRLEGGLHGSNKFFLEYDELPNYKNNTVKTPFLGVGGNNLTLPTGFNINTDLYNNLNLFELSTKRERIKAGAMFVPTEHWQFDIDFSHEDKTGVDATGSPIGNGFDKMIGSTTTSLLPEPIDQDTDLVNIKLSYAGHDGQLDLKYHASFFNNNNDSLSWENPLPLPMVATGPVPPAGSMSLAPDNEFHQLSLSGAYNLPYKSRLSGLLSMGRMTQNQSFQPYTINASLAPQALPVNSLDGEVWLTNAQLKLTSRPINRLRLNATLRYNERDNKTSVADYDYVAIDSFIKSDLTGTTVQNRPYSYKNNRFKLDANYRFNAITSLRGGYKYNEMKRSYTNAEREETEENTLFAKWKIKAHSTVDVALFAEVSTRDGSEYQPAGLENPAMRKYNFADRDRTKLGAIFDYMATDKLYLTARVDYNKDDFTNSELGLTEAIQPVYTIDFSYQPTLDITTYGYYTHETIESSQTGEDISIGASTAKTDLWNADFEDTFDTIGLGAKWTGIGKWGIGADIVFSKASGKIEMKDLNNPGTESQYPDTRNESASIKLWTDYNHSKTLSYKLGFWYEEYSADNWAVDGLLPYDPAAVRNTLLLGNKTLDYDVYVISLSASYRY